MNTKLEKLHITNEKQLPQPFEDFIEITETPPNEVLSFPDLLIKELERNNIPCDPEDEIENQILLLHRFQLDNIDLFNQNRKYEENIIITGIEGGTILAMIPIRHTLATENIRPLDVAHSLNLGKIITESSQQSPCIADLSPEGEIRIQAGDHRRRGIIWVTKWEGYLAVKLYPFTMPDSMQLQIKMDENIQKGMKPEERSQVLIRLWRMFKKFSPNGTLKDFVEETKYSTKIVSEALRFERNLVEDVREYVYNGEISFTRALELTRLMRPEPKHIEKYKVEHTKQQILRSNTFESITSHLNEYQVVLSTEQTLEEILLASRRKNIIKKRETEQRIKAIKALDKTISTAKLKKIVNAAIDEDNKTPLPFLELVDAEGSAKSFRHTFDRHTADTIHFLWNMAKLYNRTDTPISKHIPATEAVKLSMEELIKAVDNFLEFLKKADPKLYEEIYRHLTQLPLYPH